MQLEDFTIFIIESFSGASPLVREGLPQSLDEKLTTGVTVCLMGKETPLS